MADQSSPAIIIFFSFLAVITTIYEIVIIVIFLRRRHLEPIKARPLVIVTASHIALSICCLNYILSVIFWGTYPCEFVIIFNNLVPLFGSTCYIARAWMIWHKFSLTKERMFNRKNSVPSMSTSYSPSRCQHGAKEDRGCAACSDMKLWYFFHRQYATETFILRVIFAAWGLQIILPIVTTILDPPERSIAANCDRGSLGFFWYSLMMFLAVGLAIYAAYKFKEVQDGFFFKRELTGAASILIPCYICWFAIFTFSAYSREVFPIHILFPIATTLNIMHFSIVMPIRKSYSYEQAHRDPELRNLSTPQMLEYLISTKEGVQALTEQLVKEFCVENIQYFLSLNDLIERINAAEDPVEYPQINLRAVRLYTRYVITGGTREVNVPFDIAELMRRVLLQTVLNFDSLETMLAENPAASFHLGDIESAPDLLLDASGFEEAKKDSLMMLLQPCGRLVHDMEDDKIEMLFPPV